MDRKINEIAKENIDIIDEITERTSELEAARHTLSFNLDKDRTETEGNIVLTELKIKELDDKLKSNINLMQTIAKGENYAHTK